MKEFKRRNKKCTEFVLGGMFEGGHLKYWNVNSSVTLSQENSLLEQEQARTVE
jgi:hypothetical protein